MGVLWLDEAAALGVQALLEQVVDLRPAARVGQGFPALTSVRKGGRVTGLDRTHQRSYLRRNSSRTAGSLMARSYSARPSGPANSPRDAGARGRAEQRPSRDDARP